MYQRYHDRDGEPGEPRPHPAQRRSAHPVLALQRAIGNRGTARVLARDKGKNRPSFEHSVKIGKLGPIEIKGGNIAEWAAKKNPEGLNVVSAKGKHSKALKGMFDGKTRLDSVVTSSVVGENTLVTITFTNCRIAHYALDGDTEEWTVEFTGAARESLSIGAAR
jgi:hypothetical protein